MRVQAASQALASDTVAGQEAQTSEAAAAEDPQQVSGFPDPLVQANTLFADL